MLLLTCLGMAVAGGMRVGWPASSVPRAPPPRLAFSGSSAIEDPYQVLGVARGASDVAIRAAFRRVAFTHHPDRNLGDPERAKANFIRASDAYRLLT